MWLGCYSDFQSRVPEDVSLDFTKVRSLIKKHLLLQEPSRIRGFLGFCPQRFF